MASKGLRVTSSRSASHLPQVFRAERVLLIVLGVQPSFSPMRVSSSITGPGRISPARVQASFAPKRLTTSTFWAMSLGAIWRRAWSLAHSDDECSGHVPSCTAGSVVAVTG